MRSLPAVAALVALTVACTGNSPTSPTLPPNPFGGSTSVTLMNRGSLRATVDGAPWQSALTTASVVSFSGLPPQMTLSASSASGLFVSISAPAALGTYDVLGASSGFASFSLSEGVLNSWSVSPFTPGSSGTLTITTATATRVAGTFSFTAVARSQGLTPASRTVTNGTFEVFQ